MKSIVLTGGGTAGHVIPHFSILNELTKTFDKVYYIGSSGIEKQLVLSKGIEFFEIETCKLTRSLTPKNLAIPFTLIKSVKNAKEILKTLKPNVVFSKGGYVGLPVTIASNSLNIPVIIHESDLTLGLANKIASRFARFTLTSFYETSKIKNGVYVGPPIREELFKKDRKKCLEKFGFSGEKPVLLVTGGSLGAKYLNELLLACLDGVLKEFDVLHIVGKGNLTSTKIKGYYQTEFTDMQSAYSACDVCVSRAGSNTAFELVLLNIPSLLIPLPAKSSRGDQIENAKYFYNRGLLNYALQEDLNENNFLSLIKNTYNNKDKFIKNFKKSNITAGNKKIVEILNKY
ncbi:MAG: UDP-N-acetylglucosamine--N-acetylmuramyl-(pentapeptide) pyrophosphoryl-undecaprenol N-acetylglucosamine transferase [Clostridia bacterium]|nr:UDP-N-acetylglucosamine--N-acetylmuramyl-(pentapeptide) pyrophosphoryl-undecaprenol N-acetylglucosamine transferase [Clostridia bacterium]